MMSSSQQDIRLLIHSYGEAAEYLASSKWDVDHPYDTDDRQENPFTGQMGYEATVEAYRRLLPALREFLSNTRPRFGRRC